MKRLFAVLIIMNLFLMPGCKKDDFFSYPAVYVPQYSSEDYYNLLFDKNPEIVYNSVCNLFSDADSIAKNLSDKKADRNSNDYIDSLNIYTKVMQLLHSKNERVVSACLKFLQSFSGDYANNTELIGPILKVKSKNINVQFEQLIVLSMIVSKETKIDDDFMNRSVNNKSWLVSRAAYSLVNKLENERIRRDLIGKYKSTDKEFEKLLILTALENNFSNNTFDFFTGEILETKNDRVKKVILMMLRSGQDKDMILGWLDKNYENLPKEDISYLAGYYGHAYDDFSTSLLIMFIKKGFIPDIEFLEQLNNSISEYKSKKDLSESGKFELNNMLKIKHELLTNDLIKTIWKSLGHKKSRKSCRGS